MEPAIADAKDSGLSMYAAGKKYGIPEPTLGRHVRLSNVGVIGRPTTLTAEEESEIVETCKIFAGWGYSLTETDVLNVMPRNGVSTNKIN